MKTTLVFASEAEVSSFLIEKWNKLGLDAIEDRGRFTVALSGGKSPLGFYKSLAKSKWLHWDKTYVFLADERFVPFSDINSNYRVIKESLLDKAGIPPENIFPIEIKETPELSAKNYSQRIKDFWELEEGRSPDIDLILLGIGQDGHTASLFPETKALGEKKSPAASVELPPIKNKRITLTLPVLNHARNIIFLVLGTAKAEIVKNTLANCNRSIPASLVNPVNGEVLFLLDTASASLLHSLPTFNSFCP